MNLLKAKVLKSRFVMCLDLLGAQAVIGVGHGMDVGVVLAILLGGGLEGGVGRGRVFGLVQDRVLSTGGPQKPLW